MNYGEIASKSETILTEEDIKVLLREGRLDTCATTLVVHKDTVVVTITIRVGNYEEDSKVIRSNILQGMDECPYEYRMDIVRG